VFTAGGDSDPYDGLLNGLNGIHLFDKATEKYVDGGKLMKTRWYPGAFRMSNNDVWVMGGQVTGNQYQVNNDLEIISE
jgi:hypothetical protein